MSLIIKSNTTIKASTSIGKISATDILSLWGVVYVQNVGVTLTNVGGYTVRSGITDADATITGPLIINDGVTLTIEDTAILTVN